MSVPDASATPSLGPRVAAFATLALLLTVAVYGAYSGFAPGATVENAPVAKALGLGGTRAAQPGATVAFYLELPKGEPGAKVDLSVAEASGLAVRIPEAVTRDAEGDATIPVYATIPEDAAPGKRLFALTIDKRLTTLVLNVLPERAEAPAAGTRMLVDFVLRDGEGRLFSTTLADVARSNLTKHPQFFAAASYAPRGTIQGDRSFAPEVITSTLDAMVPGESRTLFLTPEQGFPEWVPADEIERTVSYGTTVKIVRETTGPLSIIARTLGVTPAELENASIGSEYETTVYGMKLPLVLAAKEGRNVTIAIAAEEGDTFTRTQFLAPGATGGSTVTLAGFFPGTTTLHYEGDQAVFVTKPPMGGKLTVRNMWPEMTTVSEVTDDRFTLRHDLAEGFTWTEGPITYRVGKVTDEAIETEARDRSNPLAGQPLIVDLMRHAAPQP
ncbi:MAG TPA: hypothetical protein VNZ52_13925 [Candidatus Thermoplasmatota archaeon]|nr:hypothetical protein [Candidatus Thermoplasmatota archaeon]